MMEKIVSRKGAKKGKIEKQKLWEMFLAKTRRGAKLERLCAFAFT